jgi:hypothetical protein
VPTCDDWYIFCFCLCLCLLLTRRRRRKTKECEMSGTNRIYKKRLELARFDGLGRCSRCNRQNLRAQRWTNKLEIRWLMKSRLLYDVGKADNPIGAKSKLVSNDVAALLQRRQRWDTSRIFIYIFWLFVVTKADFANHGTFFSFRDL